MVQNSQKYLTRYKNSADGLTTTDALDFVPGHFWQIRQNLASAKFLAAFPDVADYRASCSAHGLLTAKTDETSFDLSDSMVLRIGHILNRIRLKPTEGYYKVTIKKI